MSGRARYPAHRPPDVDDEGRVVVAAGRYARSAILTAFEMIGGVEAMARWAMDNRSEFYTRLFARIVGRETAEEERRNTVEAVLEELDARAIEAEPVDIDEDGDEIVHGMPLPGEDGA